MDNAFDAGVYGPVFEGLLNEARLNPLDGGEPNEAARSALEALTVEGAFEGRRVADADMARACISGAWLYHNFLDASHTISQGIATPTGSFWHGIMHRREPDFSNSKYWFKKVGAHPVYGPLGEAAAALAQGADESAAFLAGGEAWDPFAFVDLCEACLAGRSAAEALCRQVQQREFELLFDYCYKKAIRG